MPTKWPHDDTASKRAFYGDFRQKEWAAFLGMQTAANAMYAPVNNYFGP